MMREAAGVGERRVWDLPVRVFHWTLLLAVVGSYVTHELGIAWFRYHVWCGYTVLVLVAFRIIWGVVGTRHAQFRHFVRGPITTVRFGLQLLRGTEPHFAGHNPLGAWMVLLLLAALLAQATLGLFGNDEIYNLGPLSGYVSQDLSIAMTSWHRQLFWWIVVFIALHVLAVIYHRVVKRDDLVRAMLNGRKPAAAVPESEAIGASRSLLAVAIVALLVAVLVWVVQHAPVPAAFDSFN